MTEPYLLSDADLLVWAVVLGYRDQQERDGITALLLPLPPCPACKAAVHEGTASWVREINREELTIDMRPCGHAHRASLRTLEELHDHVSAMLRNLEHQTMTTDEIIREAHARLGQPAATEATDAAESSPGPWTQLEARAFNAVLPALREAREWLPLSVRRKVARAVLAEVRLDLGDLASDEPELTAEEARDLADDLGLQLYRAQDALAFVGECCDIADREQRAITTADVREWLKGARCGRQLAADHLHADHHQPKE